MVFLALNAFNKGFFASLFPGELAPSLWLLGEMLIYNECVASEIEVVHQDDNMQ